MSQYKEASILFQLRLLMSQTLPALDSSVLAKRKRQVGFLKVGDISVSTEIRYYQIYGSLAHHPRKF